MIPTLIVGMCIGSIYALMAFSIAIVYRGTHKVNFAHGEFGALGVYIYLQISVLDKHNAAIGVVLGLLTAGACGLAFGLLARRMERGDGEGHALVPLIGSFGLFLLIRALTVVWWSAHEPYNLPKVFGSSGFRFSGQEIPYSYLGSLGATIAVGIVVAALMRFTKVGLQIRALVANRTAAELSGLPTRRLENITWFAGTAVGAVAAYLYFQNSSLIAGNVDLILIPAFAIAAVGGFEHLGAIAIASVVFGLIDNLIDRYANFPAQEVVSLALLVVLLFVMPRGILVQRSSRYS